MAEVINIDSATLEPVHIKLDSDTSKTGSYPTQQHTSTGSATTDNLPSVNFGPGIELLMNEKKKSDPTKPSSIDLGDLNNLEKDLNSLTNNKRLERPRSVIFSEALNKDMVTKLTPASAGGDIKNINTELGKASKTETTEEKKTWDGFGKIKDTPFSNKVDPQPALGREELLRKKFEYLKKLEVLEKKGVKLTKKYTMDSSLDEMQGEYEMVVAEREKSNSVKFQGRMLMAAITGLEFLNNRFDPFDIHLEGWGEQVNESIDDYDDIFGELHEKYSSKAAMAPELKLLFQLGGSAIMVHMTNTMFKSSMPGMDDIMRQNPELMQQFTQAAVNSMGETSPGFSGFMNNFSRPEPQPRNVGAPPPAMRTQTVRSQRPPPSRPDLGMARGEGISVEEQFESVSARPPPHVPTAPPARSMPADAPKQRPEMKGPSDINNILSSLKTRKVDMPTKREGSTISVQDLKELSNTKVPKSKKRGSSAKNTVSLDI